MKGSLEVFEEGSGVINRVEYRMLFTLSVPLIDHSCIIRKSNPIFNEPAISEKVRLRNADPCSLYPSIIRILHFQKVLETASDPKAQSLKMTHFAKYYKSSSTFVKLKQSPLLKGRCSSHRKNLK
jgi:hypothetical protein